jgi:hypothetical protein
MRSPGCPRGGVRVRTGPRVGRGIHGCGVSVLSAASFRIPAG